VEEKKNRLGKTLIPRRKRRLTEKQAPDWNTKRMAKGEAKTGYQKLV